MLALGFLPLDALLPKGWLIGYVAFLALLPFLLLAFIALRLRLKAWFLPQNSPVDPAALPADVRRHVQPWLGRLGFIGFTTQGCTRTRDEQDRESYVWRMVHGNDRSVALIKAVIPSPGSRPAIGFTLLSFLPDGAVVVTADREPAPRLPAHWHAVHRQFATLQDQVDLHRTRMDGLSPVLPLPAVLPDPIPITSQREFVRQVLAAEVDLRADGTQFVDKALENPRSIEYRRHLNSEGSPTELVAGGYRWRPGTELNVPKAA